MLNFTDAARKQVISFMEQEGLQDQAVRLSMRGSPLVPEYDISLVEAWDEKPDDTVVDVGGFKVFLDPESARLTEGATVDWVQSLRESGFKIENPNVKPLGSEAPTGPLAERVRQIIDTQINPGVATHGGHVLLVDVRDSVVYLRLSGGCQGCGMATVTLRQGIERMIKEAVPEVTEIVDVTDHAAGTNPYFQPAK